MKVHKTKISDNSLIQIASPNSDFEDCYSVVFNFNKQVDIHNIILLFFEKIKIGWVDSLFKLRNWLVKPFNVKRPEDYNYSNSTQLSGIKKGSKIGFFEIKELTHEEVLLHIDDNHLSAYLSVTLLQEKNQKELIIATTVFMKNRFGKIYFFVIKPFHKIVVKAMLRKTVLQIVKEE